MGIEEHRRNTAEWDRSSSGIKVGVATIAPDSKLEPATVERGATGEGAAVGRGLEVAEVKAKKPRKKHYAMYCACPAA